MHTSIRNMNYTMVRREEIAYDSLQDQRRRECKKIIDAIRPFFTGEMWSQFVDAGPDDNMGFLSYLKEEWERIYNEFQVAS